MKNFIYLLLLCCTMVLIYSCEKEDELILQEAPASQEILNAPQSYEAGTDLTVRTTTIPLLDVGWSGWTEVNDCATGFNSDEWMLTLTCTSMVTIGVYDDFIVGDYFDVLIDGNIIGTTPDPGFPGTVYSEGEFTVTLDPGAYLIQVRDLFDFSIASYMCPAGLRVDISLIVVDSDGDGCCDSDDDHPNSDPNLTFMIDGCDSGVPNYFDPDLCGSNLGDLIMDLADGAKNHGQFVSRVAHLLNDAIADGWLTEEEKDLIMPCVAQSNYPL